MNKYRCYDEQSKMWRYSNDDRIFIKHEKKNDTINFYKENEKFGGWDRVGQAFQYTGFTTNSKEIYDNMQVSFSAGDMTDVNGVIEFEDGTWIIGIDKHNAVFLSDVLQHGNITIKE